MSAAAHTPGPWGVIALMPAMARGGKDVALVGQVDRPEAGVDGLSDEYAVAVVPLAHDEAGANVRLISAAPDLLEALQEATAHYITSAHAHSRDGHCDTIDEAVNVRRWRAAIAKATGAA